MPSQKRVSGMILVVQIPDQSIEMVHCREPVGPYVHINGNTVLAENVL